MPCKEQNGLHQLRVEVSVSVCELTLVSVSCFYNPCLCGGEILREYLIIAREFLCLDLFFQQVYTNKHNQSIKSS